LLDRIGVGARAEVFRAERPGSSERVALKRVLAGAAHDAQTRVLLFEEADLLAQLEHPGVVRSLDRGVVSGVPYVVYELVDGKDLSLVAARARDRSYALSLDFVLTVAIRVADALAHVHALRIDGSEGGVIHRDIGPPNILVGRDGAIKLCDFGIAKVRGRNTTTGIGEIKGTVRYMSPEQVSGVELDARSDLYSLGAVILELLAGRQLFGAARPVEILQRLSRGEYPSPDELAPQADSMLLGILRKVLAKNREERYDSAAHFLAALRGLETTATVGDEAVVRVLGELFPEAESQRTLEESQNMADEKAGSDLDVFEGLAKKSTRPSSMPAVAPPPGPMSSRSAPPPVPSGPLSARPSKSTLLGVPVPLPPPTSTPLPSAPPAPPPKSIAPLPPPAAPTKSVAPLPPPGKSPSGPPTTKTESALPPPSKAPNTLVAAVAPPPKPLPSLGAQLGMPSATPAATESAEERTPPKGNKKSANVDMDWEDEEESTHVFEKQLHGGLTKSSGPRPAAGMPASGPQTSKVGAAAALLAGSGGTAAARSVPPPPAVPAALPMPAPLPAPAPVPAAPAQPHPPTLMSRRPTEDQATEVRPQQSSGGGSKLGIILGGLALVAVVVLGVYMLLPRTGQLKIELKAKSGQQIAKAEIFVDGQKKCDTTPCVVDGLDTGSKTIKVIAPNADPVSKTATVEAGKERVVFVDIDDGAGTPDADASASTSATAAPPKGTGFLASGPSDVKVFVDGKDRGPLPVSLTDLSAGEHSVKFDGGERYASSETKITVEKNKVTDLGAQKPKVLKGRLTLELRSAGADVVLSGNLAGKKVEKKIADSVWTKPPVRIDLDTQGEWKLAASKKGFEDFKKDVAFPDGEAEQTIVIDLVEKGAPTPPTTATTTAPPPSTATATATATATNTAPSGTGKLNMNSIPVSKVILDGRPLGSTPQIGISVSAGRHTVTFISPDKGKKSVSVNVEAGKTATASTKF